MQQTRDQDDQRRGDAYLRISRRKGDEENRHRHDARHQHHRGLTAFTVAVHAQHDAAYRTHQKTHAENGQGQQNLVDRAFGIVGVGRKKQFRHDGRHECEDQEVIPFQRIANNGSQNISPSNGCGGHEGFPQKNRYK